MKRAMDQITEHIRLCDAIIYVLDARAPLSCLNPGFNELLMRKPVLFVLNKIDLAPDGTLDLFRKHQKGTVITLNSRVSGTSKKIVSGLNKLLHERLAAAKAKGITRPIRAIVIGVTNSGKSTLINNLAKKGKTKTGDRPGVTRTKQWVATNESLLWVLDTPGTLWPKLDNQRVAQNLCFIGSIKGDVVDIVELAKILMSRVGDEAIIKRFGTTCFDEIKHRRGKQDDEQTARAILGDFREGRLGRICLDFT